VDHPRQRGLARAVIPDDGNTLLPKVQVYRPQYPLIVGCADTDIFKGDVIHARAGCNNAGNARCTAEAISTTAPNLMRSPGIYSAAAAKAPDALIPA